VRAYRSLIQLALLVAGLVVWGVGSRIGDERLTWVGIACFAAAFLLRFAKKKDATPE
jgi:uncharacterized membrane protein YccC